MLWYIMQLKMSFKKIKAKDELKSEHLEHENIDSEINETELYELYKLILDKMQTSV